MATTAEIKNGLCIEFNHDIYQFVEFQHVKPGKGNAFVRCRMKSLRTGRVLEHTFPAGHDITTARVMRKPHQFLSLSIEHFLNKMQKSHDFLFTSN